ncbi:rhamnan synthesis F family protein [uncultured Tateyamaria sp.]|uniref:rhamnan synthesis F family protein n=1 Tax=uncultured Tateyamaria sp. TaxID=455651 RepID=UPI0026337C89|nr:rhamnan synthesis F family protein [uncultured Tateyamaria sp.]
MVPLWKIKRESIRIGRQASSFIIPIFGYFRKLLYDFRRKSRVKVYQGISDLRDEVSILLIFQPSGLLESTITQIKWLSDAGMSVVVVSNSDLAFKDRETLKKLCYLIVERPNIGYDFGGYREGILQLYDRRITPKFLYVMNDSIWLPLSSTTDLIYQSRAAKEDVWGIFLSLDAKPREKGLLDDEHIQSFFFRFSFSIMQDRRFWRYWKRMPLINSKRMVIKLRELKMGNYFKKLGYEIGAMYNWKQVRDYILNASDENEMYAIIKHQCKLRDGGAKSILPSMDSGRLSALNARDRLRERIEKNQALFYSFAMHPYIMVKFGFPFLKKAYSDEMIAMRRELVRLGLHNDFLPEVREEVAEWDSASTDHPTVR